MLSDGLNITKKDYILGALIGLLTGVLSLQIFSFLKIDFKFQKEILLLGIPIVFAFGVWLGKFLGNWIPFFSQFGKFAAVGFLGAAIDFSILNAVSFSTGVTAGITLGWINLPGFLAAVLNNYLWNKLWVFKKTGGKLFGDFTKFFGVTIAGLIINSATIIILTSVSFGFEARIWLNISKIIANAVAMIWNFIGYRVFAFRKNE